MLESQGSRITRVSLDRMLDSGAKMKHKEKFSWKSKTINWEEWGAKMHRHYSKNSRIILSLLLRGFCPLEELSLKGKHLFTGTFLVHFIKTLLK